VEAATAWSACGEVEFEGQERPGPSAVRSADRSWGAAVLDGWMRPIGASLDSVAEVHEPVVSFHLMSGELVFTISGGDASPSVPVTFAEAGLQEREHLQEWVLAYPQILGEDLRIVSFEFDRWLAGSGEPTYDRLDVLALDRGGRLVVAELKRDRAPTTVSMHALNYAAMVSQFNLNTLAEVYAAHRGSEQLTSEQALAELREWAPELSDETLGPPRIVLVATDFGSQVTNTR
jgi:hypothetical protein